MTLNDLPVIMVAATLMGAYIVPLASPARLKGAVWLALGLILACFIASLVLAWAVMSGGPIVYSLGGWAAPWGIEVGVDGPVAFMLGTVTLLSLVSLGYAYAGLQDEVGEKALRWFWTLCLLLVASMMGIVMARDLFNLFVFVEIASLAACGIVSVKGDGPALESTLRYLILSALGTGALLFGVALTYMATGHLNMVFISGAMAGALARYPGNIYAALGFITVGLGVKAALFPLHTWLPDAHSDAPTPSSALLSGLVVKVFAFAYWRVLTMAMAPALSAVPVEGFVVVLGAMATVAGSVLAAVQHDIKRLLAYSTVAQVGCIFIGFGLGGQQAVTGALLHVLYHGAMKAGLFLAAGSVIVATGKRSVEDMAGLGKTLPVPMAVFLVMALSMVGIPPLAGFNSKWYMVMGALEQGQPLVAIILVLSSALTLVYMYPVLARAYFMAGRAPALTVGWPSQVPMLVLAALVVILGFVPAGALGLAVVP
jgi:multicomponent Na+:H+ antiporter subunit D